MSGAEASASRPVAEWLAAVAAASGTGDHLQAIDLATRALHEHPESLPLEYRRLLAYARAGATGRAESRLAALESEGRLATIAEPRLRTDFAALKGRLLKDRAVRATDPSERARLAADAAQVYERVFDQSQTCFPAINAATLWQVAGATGQASAMARAALAHAADETDAYWRLATQAEAQILLSDEPAAAAALRAASLAGAGRLDDIASTRRQLSWLARVTGTGNAALAAMPVPRVVHWLCDPRSTADPARALPGTLAAGTAGLVAIGSVLSAADLAMAEVLRDRGAELALVLPCSPEICRSSLVARHGAAIGERFTNLLSASRNISAVTPEGDPGETTVLTLALEQARGQALLRGASLVAQVEVLACDAAGVEIRAAPPGASDITGCIAGWPDLAGGDPAWSGRTVRAIVFGDVKGFSTISETQHAAFLNTVVGGFADALAPLREHVEYEETAGDGVYLVLSDVLVAVAACRALHRSIEPERLRAAGLPPELALRLSAHVGPVFRGFDRVINRQKFFGKEVIRTARIEPVTPPGQTYVTEQFASVLSCMTGAPYGCEYVGHQPMAKGFGECRMYSLLEAEG